MLEHVRACVQVALGEGRHSLALGTALQFETTLRQRDVIGEWEPIPEGETWNGIVVTHDLSLCPIAFPLLSSVPEVRRRGPLIIDEKVGRPYAEHAYQREWRVIAGRAGLPHGVWNMDARAGGLSEGNDAGAPLEDLAAAAGHSQLSTTKRNVRATANPSRRVMLLRAGHRKAGDGK